MDKKLSESRFSGFKDLEDECQFFGERGTDHHAGRALCQAGG